MARVAVIDELADGAMCCRPELSFPAGIRGASASGQVVLYCALHAPNRTHCNSKSSRNGAVLAITGKTAIYGA
jgi:hypothetical protein